MELCTICHADLEIVKTCGNPRCHLNVRDSLLQEREKTHGDFRSNAAISQRLKRVINENTTKVAETLCDVHREALDMICLKLSRILSGQASVKDHWNDIAGYAKLGAEACE